MFFIKKRQACLSNSVSLLNFIFDSVRTPYILALLMLNLPALGQIARTPQDTTSKLQLEAYADLYYAYNFNRPAGGDQPYFVSMTRHNEMNINLAYIAVAWTSERVRARVAPAIGTYMNANYAAEEGTLKNVLEASAGIKLSGNKNIWLDAGVLSSPYSNESAISKDQLAYTRSFASEFVPYYLSGVKLSMPLGKKLKASFYLINGWQQIRDENSGKSLGTHLEYRPGENTVINWATYTGSESSEVNPDYGTRYFSDFSVYYHKNRISVSACAYAGYQERAIDDGSWWQSVIIGGYDLSTELTLVLRMEYFNDRNQVLIDAPDQSPYFSTYGSSIGLNARPFNNIMLRVEARNLWSSHPVYTRESIPVNNSQTITGALTFWY